MPKPANHCPECGGSLPANTLAGLCPRCVARSAGFDGEDGLATTPPGTDPLPDSVVPLRSDEKREFVVESEIARGGMGIVFAAQEPSIGRRVVLKFLRPEREADTTALNRFLTEARITGQLEHPAIVPVYHLGFGSDGRPFYAMRHIRGESLAAILDRLRNEESATVAQYPLGALLGIFQKICDAVAYAHSRGVVHRDLKPDNIMLGSFGEVVVMDWGLAKVIGSSSDEDAGQPEAAATKPGSTIAIAATLDETVMGTLGFMAPEQAEGRSNQADQRADIYALGAILYAMLTLRPPIRGKDTDIMLDRTRSGDIRPPSDYNPGVSRAVQPIPLPHCPNRRIPNVLSVVAMKALACDPSDRYQQVAELQRDIAAYQGGFATVAEQAGWLKQTELFIRRHKTITIAATIVLLLTIGFMAKIIASERKARETLANLRSTAPTFYEAAVALVDEQKLDEALDKITFAVSVAPDEANYHQFRANMLQTRLDLKEAQRAFLRARALNSRLPFLNENVELCAQLLKRMSNGVLSPVALRDLHAALIKQGRGSEALVLSNVIKEDRKQLVEACKTALKAAGIPEGRLTFGADYLNLDLDKFPIRDLTPLRGLPLTLLRISGTQVEDLAPLKGMPLRSIWMHGLPGLRDLTPLRGPQLREIQMGFTRVKDLSPLKGLQLTGLVANNNPIADLSPLRGLPLEELSIGSSDVTDLSPLAGMTSLKKLNASYLQITNLAPLTGLFLNQLHLEATTRVSDLTPLRGMPLKELYLHDCRRVKDLSPLTNCLSLQRLTLPTAATNIAVLRNLPALQSIYFAPPKGVWTNNAAEFWQADDARQRGRK